MLKNCDRLQKCVAPKWRLDEWPAITQSGEEGKIIIVAIKVHIFATSPPFYCVALEKSEEWTEKGQRLCLLPLILLLLLLSSVLLCELEMLGPESYSDVAKAVSLPARRHFQK